MDFSKYNYVLQMRQIGKIVSPAVWSMDELNLGGTMKGYVKIVKQGKRVVAALLAVAFSAGVQAA